jgi:E3 ubiquitin-protein ligase SIAH1
MEDLSRVLDEALLSDLECPECLEYMVPPITLCPNGHSICSKCREEVDGCPTCREKFTIIRSVTFERIARRQKYPCANRDNGCPDLLSIEDIAEHKAVCTHGSIKCPLNKTIFKCSWMGLISDLEKHATAAHSVQKRKHAEFNFSQLQSEAAFLFCLGKVFMYYKMVSDGRFYCAVQLIGPSSQASKFKCEFNLRSASEMEQLRNTFFVRSYSEDFETSFNSGKCVRLDDATVRNFVVEGKLKMFVTLSRVQ